MKQEFTATMLAAEGIDGAYVEVPFDVQAVFGAKRVKVKAWFDNVLYRGSIVRMDGKYVIGITKALRAQIGKGAGSSVKVVVEKDDEERTAVLPADLQAVLEKNPVAKEQFFKLSYTHQKEYTTWVETAKREETRTTRLAKALELLLQGKPLR